MASKAQLLSVVLLFPALMGAAPNSDQIMDMTGALKLMFVENPFLLTAAVRLGLHDCVGGCDGCLNLANPDNAGLEEIVVNLENLYWNNGYSEVVGHADFWALAATVAVERGVVNANIGKCGCENGCPMPTPNFDYLWGRQDCDSSPLTGKMNTFPSPAMSSEEMFEYFNQTFGFNSQEVVALLGAHSLGGADSEDSGYNGVWTPGIAAFSFDNSFYKLMIDTAVQWTIRDVSVLPAFEGTGQRWQWEGVDDKTMKENGRVPYMFFNTDFDVFFNVTVDETGKPTCILDTGCPQINACGLDGTCAKSETYEIAELYAKDAKAFMRDFQLVFDKMLRTGY